MNWELPFTAGYNTETIGGISFSVYKSAIQKFLRRGEYEKGLGTLRLLKNIDVPEGRRLVSNVINRMVVMMSEEISINNPLLPKTMYEMYTSFEKSRNYDLIYRIYTDLCISKKCRLLSDVKSTFNLKPYYLQDLEKLNKIHKQIAVEYSNMYEFNYTMEETLACIDKYIKTYNVFIYISHYLRKDYESKMGAQKLWKIVLKHASKESTEVVKALKFFYTKMKHKEKMLYFYHAVLVVMHQDVLDFSNTPSTSIEFEYPLIDNKFPDYVYDIHTGSKKDVLDFALDGALVVNECTKYKNEKWRKYYIQFKERISGRTRFDAVLTKKYMNECIRGQKLTSYTKPFVYIPTSEHYGNMVGNVYKGPYLKTDKRNILLTMRIDMLRGTKYVLLPEKISQEKDDWYMFKYLGSIKDIKYTEQHDNVSNTDIKVIDREKSKINQVSKLSEEEMLEVYNKIIYSLLDLFIMGVGDVGPWNMLMSDNEPYIIDIEDTRSNEILDIPLCKQIMTKTSKKNAELLQKVIDGNKEEIIKYVAKHVESKRFTNEYFKYINRNPNDVIDYILKHV